MKKCSIRQRIMMALNKLGCRLFRNNTGSAWSGKVVKVTPENITTVSVTPGDVIIRQGKSRNTGLIEGTSNLVGWTTKTITPDMVGQRIAIFTSLEVKEGLAMATLAQSQFLDDVRSAGGIARVVHSEEEAINSLCIDRNESNPD